MFRWSEGSTIVEWIEGRVVKDKVPIDVQEGDMEVPFCAGTSAVGTLSCSY